MLLRRLAAAVAVTLSIGSPTAALAWRSDLYPADWEPGLTDGAGRFLHDFSYAGYHNGELDLPASVPGPVVDVTLAPYGADMNGWLRDVTTYRPAANASDVHLLSNGVRMDAARNITVRDVDLRRPQYLGAGGNGYMIVLSGQECLVERATTARGRHNFSFSLMQSSGNVVFDSAASHGKLPVDFHMHLSMANLIDNLTLDHDFIEARHRDCCGHGHGTTQSVFWNTEGLAYPSDQFLVQFIVHSVQFGHGYVIGTHGPAGAVQTFDLEDPATPVDWVEGQGQGETLEPASLWIDQRERRLGVGGEGGDDANGGGGGATSSQAASGAGGGGIGGSSASGGAQAEGPGSPVACGCSAPGAPTSPAWPWPLLASFIALRRRPVRRPVP